MPLIPLIYFIALFAFFLYRQRCWGMDLAATALLIVISAGAVMIDMNDIYGDYGINDNYMTLPTVLLFCLQWTLVLLPLHFLSGLPLQQHPPVKEKLLYVLTIVVGLASLLMIAMKAGDIKEALIMDLADVREEHYDDLAAGAGGDSNYWLLLPNIITVTPFPTLALFLWFYMKSFMKVNILIRAGILVASIVQAIIAIIMAGRAAMIFWAFDFFLIYSFFYRYLSTGLRRTINATGLVLGGLAAFMFVSITIARFDEGNYDPFESLYGYAGQHLNNFCTMIVKGGDTELSLDRIFPLFSKLTGHPYDMYEHYQDLLSHTNAVVNVFDTFGAELFLDLGWFGYLFFLLFLFVGGLYIRFGLHQLEFRHIFVLAVVVAFFTRGLFAWPFTGHYTTLALMLIAFAFYLFKYQFKI